MLEIVPVSVRCSDDGERWFAKGLTYSAQGRGPTPSDALKSLKQELAAKFPGITPELRIRSLSVTFPSSLSEDAFLVLDVLKHKAELAG